MHNMSCLFRPTGVAAWQETIDACCLFTSAKPHVNPLLFLHGNHGNQIHLHYITTKSSIYFSSKQFPYKVNTEHKLAKSL